MNWSKNDSLLGGQGMGGLSLLATYRQESFEANNILIKDIKRRPFAGIGDPEPLRHHWSGYWSRRIDREHRLVYKATEKSVIIVQCRYHY